MLFQTGTQIDEIVDVDTVTAADIGTAAVILVVTGIVAIIVRRLLRRYLRRLNQLSDPIALTVTRGTTYLIVTVGVLLALPFLGFQIQPALILVLIGGVLFFFAARPLMEDFSSGMIIQTRSPFVVGDLIRYGDHLGVVVDIDGRVSVLVTLAGETVRIKNTAILRDPIVNLTAQGRRRSVIEVGVAYGTDLDAARSVLMSAVEHSDSVLDSPEPRVFVESYGDSSINLEVWAYHGPSILEEYQARDEVIRSINNALETAGIVIAFPQRDIWFRNPLSNEDDPQGTP